MNHHHHAQYPYIDEIKRELLTRRIQRRARAALDFIILVVLFGGIGVMLAWRG